MSAPSKSKFYLATIALFLGAIAAGLFAQHHVGRSIRTMARAANSPAERPRLRQVATQHIHRAYPWNRVSLAIVTLAAGSWAISRHRREPGLQGVPLVLASSYLLLSLLLI